MHLLVTQKSPKYDLAIEWAYGAGTLIPMYLPNGLIHNIMHHI